MADGLIVYVKNPTQRENLKRKYPNIDASFINMKGATEGLDEMLPLVCMTKDGEERCEAGEQYIEDFAKKMGGNNGQP